MGINFLELDAKKDLSSLTHIKKLYPRPSQPPPDNEQWGGNSATPCAQTMRDSGLYIRSCYSIRFESMTTLSKPFNQLLLVGHTDVGMAAFCTNQILQDVKTPICMLDGLVNNLIEKLIVLSFNFKKRGPNSCNLSGRNQPKHRKSFN